MKSAIQKLFDISNKSSRLIIGLMSGTSLDGLDIALCKTEGNGLNTKVELLNFKTISYHEDFRNQIKSVFSKPIVETQQLCLMNEYIGKKYAQIINETLIQWKIKNSDVDLIANHGQTIYHAPLSFHHKKEFGNGTLQIGDGDQIAHNTKIITISDFRQKHIAAGGEGAPLATYGDYLLFSDQNTNRILLNIGGISNLTFLPANAKFNEVTSTDIGPGNTLMNVWAKKKYNLDFDENASIAKSGIVHQELLSSFLNHPYFNLPYPRTTGPEVFNIDFIEQSIQNCNGSNISAEDVMATLNRMSSVSICSAIEHYIGKSRNTEIIISGGGIYNTLLTDFIKDHFKSIKVKTSLEKGINPDAKEALLFALLANETIAGNQNTFANSNYNMPNVSMGKICLPD